VRNDLLAGDFVYFSGWWLLTPGQEGRLNVGAAITTAAVANAATRLIARYNIHISELNQRTCIG